MGRCHARFSTLLLHAGNPVSRDFLAFLFWPDTDQASARKRLRMTVHNLRRGLGPDLSARLVAEADTLAFRTAPDTVDLDLFEARATASDPLDALALYGGHLLAKFPSMSGEFDALLAGRRESCAVMALSLAHRAMLAAAEAGDLPGFAVGHQRAVALDATSAETCRMAMDFYARCGRPERIEECFHAYAGALMAEIGVPPSVDLAASRDECLQAARR